ncbi:MAG: hypothetical protein LBF42_04050, partial [Puniceicoccales bacterium]|nr:hypothetical protein [Puniceicoccales bacterium]
MQCTATPSTAHPTKVPTNAYGCADIPVIRELPQDAIVFPMGFIIGNALLPMSVVSEQRSLPTKPAAPLAKNAAVVLSPDDPFLLLRLTPLTFLFGAPICDP